MTDGARNVLDGFNEPRLVMPSDVVAILAAVDGRLGQLRQDIKDDAGERWLAHEQVHADERRRHDELAKEVHDHHRLAHDSQIARDARVMPIRTVAQTIRAYWPQITTFGLLIALLWRSFNP